jgi:hypothetical protein
MSSLGCFTCLNCGKNNAIKGHSYTNKFCNNSCQAQYRSRSLVREWKESKEPTAWRQVPDWVKKYLIQERGHKCQVCGITEWPEFLGHPAPLVVDYLDGDSYNNREDNLQLICPNCKSQK